MSFFAYQLKFSFVKRFGYQRIVSFYLLEYRWPPANGWHVKPTCLAHNEIIRNAGARVKIWPMSVTALLGEALRWARGARVCNKPALFWRFGGAVAIWVCISFAYSTSSKTGSSTFAKHTPKTYPETDYRLFFLLEEKHVPRPGPRNIPIFGELLGSWRGGSTTTTTAHHVQKHRPRPPFGHCAMNFFATLFWRWHTGTWLGKQFGHVRSECENTSSIGICKFLALATRKDRKIMRTNGKIFVSGVDRLSSAFWQQHYGVASGPLLPSSS